MLFVADGTTRKQLEDDAEYKTELALYPVGCCCV
jgi:hypothetical protein